MKKALKIISVICMLVPLLNYRGFSYKIHPNAGETSAAFLKIPPGGRGVSMGEAQVAVTSDVFGMWWNPAGIAKISRKTVGAGYNKWFQNMGKSFVYGVFPLYKNESIGIMFDSLVVKDDIERRSGAGEEDPFYPVTSPEGDFGAYDLLVGGSYARKLSDNLYGGVTLKGILQSIDDEKAYSGAIDIGVQYDGFKIRGRNIYMGASIRNFGTAVKFKKEAYNLPLDYWLGFGMSPANNMLVAVDFQQAIDNYMKIHIGIEYKLWDKLSLRSGYIHRFTGNPLGSETGFRGGFGVKLSNFMIDYAYSPYNFLGESHRISLQLLIGKGKKVRTRPRKKVTEIKPEKKIEANNNSSSLKIVTKPLIITPSGITWNVSCTKSSGVVSNIEYVTVQDDIDGLEFTINESTTTPVGFAVPAGKKLLHVINIKHNLRADTIMEGKIELVNDGEVKSITAMDWNHQKFTIEAIDNKLYIKIGKNNIDKIIILDEE